MLANLFLPILGKHISMALIIVAARKVEVIELQVDAEAFPSGLKCAKALGHYLAAYAIAFDDGNVESVL